MKRAPAGRLSRRFRLHLRRTALLGSDQHVLVALSGGLDSSVLLHLLRFHVPAVRVSAAHLDHAMRADSAADAAWVRGLCRAWSVPLQLQRAEPPPVSEAAARDVRYEFLHAAAKRCGADHIATAHHADDQAETLLFRLARGTGVTGLAGIPERRGIIVRPLLPFGRAELVAYAQHAGLRWRNDPSNVELRYARNRIRHLVLPALDAVRPGAASRIAVTATRVAEAESAWREVVQHAVSQAVVTRDEHGYALARERLLDYHPHIRARVIRHLIGRLGTRAGRAGTGVAMAFISSGASGARVDIGDGVVFAREFDLLHLRAPRPVTSVANVPLTIPAAAPGAGTFVAGGTVHGARWAWARADAGPEQTASFDPSSLRFPLELRAWRAGDRIRLAYGSKKLKKLFRERRVGRAQRGVAAVLSDAAGEILWVVGLARSTVALPRHDAEAFQITVVDGDTE